MGYNFHMPVKYDRDTEWLAPFVEAARGLVDVDRLKAVLRIHLHKNRAKQAEAICTIEPNRMFTIRMYMTTTEFERLPNGLWKRGGPKSCRLYNVLETLAHEMAHMKHFDHPPRMFATQAKIMKRFAKVADTLGLVDLEMRHNRVKKQIEAELNKGKV